MSKYPVKTKGKQSCLICSWQGKRQKSESFSIIEVALSFEWSKTWVDFACYGSMNPVLECSKTHVMILECSKTYFELTLLVIEVYMSSVLSVISSSIFESWKMCVELMLRVCACCGRWYLTFSVIVIRSMPATANMQWGQPGVAQLGQQQFSQQQGIVAYPMQQGERNSFARTSLDHWVLT